MCVCLFYCRKLKILSFLCSQFHLLYFEVIVLLVKDIISSICQKYMATMKQRGRKRYCDYHIYQKKTPMDTFGNIIKTKRTIHRIKRLLLSRMMHIIENRTLRVILIQTNKLCLTQLKCSTTFFLLVHYRKNISDLSIRV